MLTRWKCGALRRIRTPDPLIRSHRKTLPPQRDVEQMGPRKPRGWGISCGYSARRQSIEAGFTVKWGR